MAEQPLRLLEADHNLHVGPGTLVMGSFVVGIHHTCSDCLVGVVGRLVELEE